MKTRREVILDTKNLIDHRFENLLKGYENYGLEDVPDEWHWLKQYAVGEGLDICCGDYTVAPEGGVDEGLRLGSVLGFPYTEGDNLTRIDSNTQDFVVSNYLEAMPCPIKALREWHRVLKPSGQLALICRNADSTQYAHTTLGPLQNKKRLNCFNENTIKFYLNRAQFKILSCEVDQERIKILCVKENK